MFHGNGGNLGHRIPLAGIFVNKMRCNVLMLCYRGYACHVVSLPRVLTLNSVLKLWSFRWLSFGERCVRVCRHVCHVWLLASRPADRLPNCFGLSHISSTLQRDTHSECAYTLSFNALLGLHKFSYRFYMGSQSEVRSRLISLVEILPRSYLSFPISAWREVDILRQINALILENTFTSLPSLVPHALPVLGPFSFLCHQKWDSASKIPLIPATMPILMLSGASDELVPKEHMRALWEAVAKRGEKKKLNGSEYKTGLERAKYMEFEHGGHSASIDIFKNFEGVFNCWLTSVWWQMTLVRSQDIGRLSLTLSPVLAMPRLLVHGGLLKSGVTLVRSSSLSLSLQVYSFFKTLCIKPPLRGDRILMLLFFSFRWSFLVSLSGVYIHYQYPYVSYFTAIYFFFFPFCSFCRAWKLCYGR